MHQHAVPVQGTDMLCSAQPGSEPLCNYSAHHLARVLPDLISAEMVDQAYAPRLAACWSIHLDAPTAHLLLPAIHLEWPTPPLCPTCSAEPRKRQHLAHLLHRPGSWLAQSNSVAAQTFRLKPTAGVAAGAAVGADAGTGAEVAAVVAAKATVIAAARPRGVRIALLVPERLYPQHRRPSGALHRPRS